MQHFALRNKYPLETAGMVKIAIDYFDRYLSRFQPEERAEIAHNLEKRASVLGVDLQRDWIDNYKKPFDAPTSYSPDFEMNMEIRKQACIREKRKVTMRNTTMDGSAMIDKLASSKGSIRPLDMMKAVTEFDKTAGFNVRYDKDIADPVITVFGSLTNPRYDMVKVAGDLTNYDLVRLSRNEETIDKIASSLPVFDKEAFKKDPVKMVSEMSAKDQLAFTSVI